MKDTNTTLKSPQRFLGLASSLYMAAAYLSGIFLFIVVLRYPSITDDLEKVRMVVGMKSTVFISTLVMYVLFGPVLVLFILHLKSRLENSETFLVKFSSLLGFIWAGSLTASGMVANAALGPVSKLFSTNPDQAVFLWQMLDTVSVGLGNGNGEILGGIMTLGFGIAMFKDRGFSKALGVFGIIIGVLGILSVVPVLMDLALVFGLLQLVWFLLVGVGSLKKGRLSE